MDRPAIAEVFLFDGFRFDRAEGGLFREIGSGVVEPLALGARASTLLAILLERPGRLITKEEIFAAVWSGMAVEEANLTMQISTLRRILDRDRQRGSCIQTVAGRGYRFVAAVQRTTCADLGTVTRPGSPSARANRLSIAVLPLRQYKRRSGAGIRRRRGG